ncbi:MAG TPA: hypothetical protein VK032_07645 [Burkholderiaceae bacterium]|nr:hypothetical protein [Burkholderiaceae bacterium]
MSRLSRLSFKLFSGVLIGGALSLSTAGAATFTYGSGSPAAANFHVNGLNPMMDAITEATDGRVSFRKLYGGTVVRLDTTLQGIRDGVIDSGYLVSTFHPAELPQVSLIGEMSAFSSNPYAAAGAANEILYKHCPNCKAELEKQGIDAVFSWATSPMVMACTSNINNAADLEKKRVSVIGSGDSRWASALGMSPTRTAVSDLASSLQLGRSDCAIIPTNWIRSYGLGDIVKSVITIPQGIGAAALPLALSTKASKAISAEDHETIRKVVADNLYNWIKHSYVDTDAEVRAQTEDKIRYIDEDDEISARWQENQTHETEALIELAKRRGIDNPEQVVNDMIAVYQRWHTEHLPKFENNPEAFGEILYQEVFAQ